MASSSALVLGGVVVHQAAGEQELPFLPGGILQIEGEGGDGAAGEGQGGEGIIPRQHLGLYIGDIDKVPGLAGERVSLGQGEGEHAPVDAVGAVPLGGKLIADVGAAPQHPLAGGGLFPGRAVAGLVGKDHRADLESGGGQRSLSQLLQGLTYYLNK